MPTWPWLAEPDPLSEFEITLVWLAICVALTDALDAETARLPLPAAAVPLDEYALQSLFCAATGAAANIDTMPTAIRATSRNASGLFEVISITSWRK